LIQCALVCGWICAAVFRRVRGVGYGFAGAADEYALKSLMVEVDVESGVPAMVPCGFGDGEVQEEHALCELAGGDHGLAEERV